VGVKKDQRGKKKGGGRTLFRSSRGRRTQGEKKSHLSVPGRKRRKKRRTRNPPLSRKRNWEKEGGKKRRKREAVPPPSPLFVRNRQLLHRQRKKGKSISAFCICRKTQVEERKDRERRGAFLFYSSTRLPKSTSNKEKSAEKNRRKKVAGAKRTYRPPYSYSIFPGSPSGKRRKSQREGKKKKKRGTNEVWLYVFNAGGVVNR